MNTLRVVVTIIQLTLLMVTTVFAELPAPAPAGTARPAADITKIASGLGHITSILPLPGSSDTLLVARGDGYISRIEGGKTQRRYVLDIEDLISNKIPNALFGMSVSRHFPVTRHLYLGYVDRQGDTLVARITVPEDYRCHPESLVVIIKVVQDAQHVRTGALSFGSDDLLYIATGDGGQDIPTAGGENPAKDLQSLLGKVLRIDVSKSEYSIPSDNPFRNSSSALPEIYASGVRDPIHLITTPELMLVDKGASKADSIIPFTAASNLGWPLREGEVCVRAGCEASEVKEGSTDNVFSYTRALGNCLGGAAMRSLGGESSLVYGDCKSGAIFATPIPVRGSKMNPTLLKTIGEPISSLSTAANGAVLIGTQTGNLYSF